MSKRTIEISLTSIVIFLFVCRVIYITNLNRHPGDSIKIKTMNLSSELFKDGEYIPKAYTCDGEDARIPLKISNVPDNAKSLTLIVNDPDAPNKNFVHWVIWNIPSRTREIIGDLLPEGSVEGKNSAKSIGWISPCPPTGIHHYHFTIYALDTLLNLPETSTESDVRKAIEGHIIESASIIGLYQKKI